MRVRCNFPLEWFELEPRMTMCQFLKPLFLERRLAESQHGGGGWALTEVNVFRMVGWPALFSTCPLNIWKSYPNFLHSLFALHSPAIVNTFRMVGGPVLSPTCSLKVREVRPPLVSALQYTT